MPVANIEGKVGLLKIDLTIRDMNGSPILIVTGSSFTSVLPEMEPIFWYTFHFPQLEKEVLLKKTYTYFNTSQFLKHEFEAKGIHFYPNGFHKDEMSLLQDYSHQLHVDTTQIIDSLQFYKKNLSTKLC